MKKTLFLFLMALLPLLLPAQNITEAQARKRIAAMASGLNTMQCDFVQTKTISMLKSKVVSRGKMYYSRPTRLRWSYTSPYSYTLVLSGSSVTMKGAGGKTVADASKNKLFKEITRIMMSSMVGTCVSDNRSFKVSLSGSGTSWRAFLIPRRSPMRGMFSSITVFFDLRRSVVSGVRMIEKNGDRTDIVLKNQKTNVPLNARIFTVK